MAEPVNSRWDWSEITLALLQHSSRCTLAGCPRIFRNGEAYYDKHDVEKIMMAEMEKALRLLERMDMSALTVLEEKNPEGARLLRDWKDEKRRLLEKHRDHV